MDTKLSITLPEELKRKATARAAQQGITLSEVVRQKLEEFAAAPETSMDKKDVSTRDKKFKKSRNQGFSEQLANEDDVKHDQQILAKLSKLATELDKHWPKGITVQEIMDGIRREL